MNYKSSLKDARVLIPFILATVTWPKIRAAVSGFLWDIWIGGCIVLGWLIPSKRIRRSLVVATAPAALLLVGGIGYYLALNGVLPFMPTEMAELPPGQGWFMTAGQAVLVGWVALTLSIPMSFGWLLTHLPDIVTKFVQFLTW